MDLNPGTLTRLVEQLNSMGLVDEETAPASGRGRPTKLVSIRPQARTTLGVHVGTHLISGAVVGLDGMSGTPITYGHDGSPEDVARLVAAVVEHLAAQAPSVIVGVGISVAGWVDSHVGVVRSHDGLQWRDVPLRQMVVDQLGASGCMEALRQARIEVHSAARSHAHADLLWSEDDLGGTFLHFFVGNVCSVAQVRKYQVVSPLARMSGSLTRLGFVDSAGAWGAFPDLVTDPAVLRRLEGVGDFPDIDAVLAAAAQRAEAEEALRWRVLNAGRGCAVLAELFGVNTVVVSGGVGAVERHLPLLDEGAAAAATAAPPRIVPIVGINTAQIPAAAAPVIAAFCSQPA